MDIIIYSKNITKLIYTSRQIKAVDCFHIESLINKKYF